MRICFTVDPHLLNLHKHLEMLHLRC